MIGYNAAAQVVAFFLHCFFYFKYFFGSNGVLNSNIMNVPYPLVNRVGGSQWQWILVEPVKIWMYIPIVKYWVAFFPLKRISGIVNH